jgi:hypothetical protein
MHSRPHKTGPVCNDISRVLEVQFSYSFLYSVGHLKEARVCNVISQDPIILFSCGFLQNDWYIVLCQRILVFHS